MTPAEQRKEWRAIAEKATPGPWAYGYWSGMCKIKHQHGGHGVCKYEYELMEGEGTNIVLRDEPVTLVTSTSEYCEFSKENAAHVATFNPATVLGLLDEVDRLNRAVSKSGQYDSLGAGAEKSVSADLFKMKQNDWLEVCKELTAAQARIKALEELLGQCEEYAVLDLCMCGPEAGPAFECDKCKILDKIRSAQAKGAT